ncbi:MAG: hypothetical protein SGI86_22335 [Deltaproteobacteria bacterium]|nr:hypothetical protein [Deltaproteobacteria bacterium]
MKSDPWRPDSALAMNRRSFGRVVAVGAASLGAGCSVILDPDSYGQEASAGSDASVREDSNLPPALPSGVLLLGGVLDGFNQGDSTKEVFLARFDASGNVTGFSPQLQVLQEARRYTARVDGDQVLAACPGRFMQSQLGAEGLVAWQGNDLPQVETNTENSDATLVFAGPWLVDIAGDNVSVLRFADAKATWKLQPNKLLVWRRMPSVVYTNKHLYILGGASPDQVPRLDGEYAAFDETNGTTEPFRALSSLPVSPFGCGFATSGKHLYAVGGNRSAAVVNQPNPHDRVFASALAGDGAPGPWREQPMLITPLADASVWVRQNRLYVAAGRRGGGNNSSVLVGSSQISANGDLGLWDFRSQARLALGRFLTFAVVI